MSAFLKALAEIEAEEKFAARGPWQADPAYHGVQQVSLELLIAKTTNAFKPKCETANQNFIAMSRNFLAAPRIAAIRAAVEALNEISEHLYLATDIGRCKAIALDALAQLDAAFEEQS